MITKFNQTIIFFLLFSLLFVCFFNQKTVLIKKGNEFELITTYKKDVESLIRTFNNGITINDIVSPNKNIRLRDGLIITIKTLN